MQGRELAEPCRVSVAHVSSTLGKLQRDGKHSSLVCFLRSFDLIVMDEAGQALPENVAHVLALLRRDGALLLMGDPRQLPAFAFRAWRVVPSMRLAMGVLPAKLLEVQHRQSACLGALTSHLFYEGKVRSSEDRIKEAPPRELLVVRWRADAQVPAEPYPARPEAHLVAALERALNADQRRAERRVLSFYRAQAQSLRELQVATPCTVDSVQGCEYESVALSCGRWSGEGFTGDRRRLCVAMSRARRGLVVLLAAGVCEKHNWWQRFVQLASRLGVLLDVELTAPDDVQRVAEAVETRLATMHFAGLDAEARVAKLRACFEEDGVQKQFDTYQLSRVGKLNAATSVPESDDEIDEEAQDEEEQHLGDESPQLADDCVPDDVDEERELLAPCSSFPLFSLAKLDVLCAHEDDHGKYAMLTVKRLTLLHHVWEQDEAPSEDVALEERVFGSLRVFARVLWDALTAYYAPPECDGQRPDRLVYEPASKEVEREFLEARLGPQGADTTLNELMRSEGAVEEWLHCLCGGRRRDRLLAQGDEQSPFFFFFFYTGLEHLKEDNGKQFVRRVPPRRRSFVPVALPLPSWGGGGVASRDGSSGCEAARCAPA